MGLYCVFLLFHSVNYSFVGVPFDISFSDLTEENNALHDFVVSEKKVKSVESQRLPGTDFHLSHLEQKILFQQNSFNRLTVWKRCTEIL